ncbi:MAG: NAD(+) synthase [Clostridia bacterium]|nr:NAD(+) synthase [Clostridia bacterium]
MKHGFIKVCTFSPEIRVADCGFNSDRIIELLDFAEKAEAKIAVFPELSVTGYTCADLFLQETLINSALKSLETIVNATKKYDMVSVVGFPFDFCGKLYNCSAVILKGNILGIIPKNHLTSMEKRWFAHAPAKNSPVMIFGQKTTFGNKQIFRCDGMDSFSFGVEIGDDMYSPIPPSSFHAINGANIIINTGSSLCTAGKSHIRRNCIKELSRRLTCSYIYAESGPCESTSTGVYGGHNLICENGELLGESKPFSQNTLVCDIDVTAVNLLRKHKNFRIKPSDDYTCTTFKTTLTDTLLERKYSKNPFLPDDEDKNEICREALEIQAMGLKKRLEHIHSDSAVIGISGGLDSTLALLVTVRAFDIMKKDRKNIIAVTMPCYGTGTRTKSNAVHLCEKLGVTLRTIDIKDAVSLHFRDIGHNPQNTNVVYENAQARERTQILMDIANAENALVIGTGDLSELALGFATFNGDHISMYGLNASLPKTLIRCVVTYCAENSDLDTGAILTDIVNTPVSPELLPSENNDISQKTEDIVGPYELHDFFIYYMIKFGFSPEKIYRMAKVTFGDEYPSDQILKSLKTLYNRFFAQQYKRSCLPDSPGVTEISFTPGIKWCMPSDAMGILWSETIDNITQED